jgi:large repetitive protein
MVKKNGLPIRLILSVLLLICTGLFSVQLSYGQGTTQVTISGIPPVLPSPFVSDIEQDYFMGQYQFQLIYNNTNPDPVEFVYEITLLRDGSEILNITSNPVVYTPGTYFYRTFDDQPEVTFQDDPIEEVSRTVREQIIREGSLPEGNYILEIEVRLADDFANINTIPGSAQFEIRFPQPAVLLTPTEEVSVIGDFITFSWTPVIGAPGYDFEYEITIVRVERNQAEPHFRTIRKLAKALDVDPTELLGDSPCLARTAAAQGRSE